MDALMVPAHAAHAGTHVPLTPSSLLLAHIVWYHDLDQLEQHIQPLRIIPA